MARVEIPRLRLSLSHVILVSEIYIYNFRTFLLAKCPKKLYKYRTGGHVSDIKSAISSQINAAGQATSGYRLTLRTSATGMRSTRLSSVWCWLWVTCGVSTEGLYDKPIINRLTQRPTTPDYRAIIDAIARRDQLRLLVGGQCRCSR